MSSSSGGGAGADAAGCCRDEHFTVDGTLIEAWAGAEEFPSERMARANRPRMIRGNPTVDFHGEKRANDTHQSTTDPDARLATKGKGKEAKLSLRGTRADGEPQRAGGEDAGDAGDGNGRARRGAGDGGSSGAASSA